MSIKNDIRLLIKAPNTISFTTSIFEYCEYSKIRFNNVSKYII